ncbi:MAG: hypothetical protein WCJ33_01515 [Pseudomonadota bacterium]
MQVQIKNNTWLGVAERLIVNENEIGTIWDIPIADLNTDDYTFNNLTGAPYTAANFTLKASASTSRTAIKTLLQSCVGVGFNSLTANQIKGLVALMLYERGALNNDATATVKPLNQWINKTL